MLHILTPEYFPQIGGVADYTRLVARALHQAGEAVCVWSPSAGTGDPGDGFTVRSALGRFDRNDLEAAGELLDRYPAPRRLLVQWVPHGYGFNAMNVQFCLWLWKRASRGDHIELMVHEPFLAFWEGSWRQTAAAAVHRFMTAVLLQSAARVWISIPAWGPMWMPYRFGRAVPFSWLPIPSSLPDADSSAIDVIRNRVAGGRQWVIGHLGTYGGPVASLLETALPPILDALPTSQVLLLGEGSTAFRERLIASGKLPEGRITATGFLADADLAAHLGACDVVIQPYPDGITSRRTSAMAALKLGVPLVTTRGRLTDRLWSDASGVMLAPVGDTDAILTHLKDLLSEPDRRKRLGLKGRELYRRFFDLRYTVDALKSAPSKRAA